MKNQRASVAKVPNANSITPIRLSQPENRNTRIFRFSRGAARAADSLDDDFDSNDRISAGTESDQGNARDA